METKSKLKLAFLYRPSNKKFLKSYKMITLLRHFYLEALPRNKDIDLLMIPEDRYFDALDLEGKIDVLLMFDIIPWGGPDIIKNLDKVSYLKVLNCGDCHQGRNINKYTNKKTKIAIAQAAKIDYFHWHHPEPYFHKFWPKECKYWQIQIGVESSQYETVKPFRQRISKKILNTGTLGGIYRLRGLANSYPHTYYSPRKNKSGIGDNYVKLLEKYRASISACSAYPVMKYIECSAAGCVNFMEITPENHGMDLGFEDGVTAVFINRKNYKNKFDEFIRNPDDPKWEKIADQGRRYALSRYSNDQTVADLISKIRDVL